MMEFEKFKSLSRFSQDWTITEKIDGTNGQIAFNNDGEMFVGSRNRWLSADADNMGFFAWCKKNEEELRKLGPGRHFGEWWGHGIQRGYGLTEKRFSLFNVNRWHDQELPSCVSLVPCFGMGIYCNDPHGFAEAIMERLLTEGSAASPGFMSPEGVILHHGRSNTTFKKTFDYDEQGKWAENQQFKNKA